MKNLFKKSKKFILITIFTFFLIATFNINCKNFKEPIYIFSNESIYSKNDMG